jgi:hypothetical protein
MPEQDAGMMDECRRGISYCLVSPCTPVSVFAVSLARTIALVGAHFITTALFVALLSTLALAGIITAVSVFDVVFSFIDAVHVSAVAAVQQAV